MLSQSWGTEEFQPWMEGGGGQGTQPLLSAQRSSEMHLHHKSMDFMVWNSWLCQDSSGLVTLIAFRVAFAVSRVRGAPEGGAEQHQ